ncbi:MAG: peptidyl-prolyl cis-trans isomerase [Acidobacteria bacterium]|nr:peptidyl-prolyl cis-trans isomerase [Acidobacteriota bacterium]
MRLHESLRRTRTRALLGTLVAVLVLVTGAPPAAAAQQTGQAAATRQAGLAPAMGGIIDRVLVRVDGRAILYSDFEAQWRDQLAVISAQFSQAEIDAQTPMFRMRIMQALAEGIMLELRAEDLGIVANVNDIDRAILNVRETNGYTDDAAWAQALAEAGMTEPMLREQLESTIVRQRMMTQEISRRVFVSQREVEAYYEQNLDTFTEPEQVLFQQIIFVYTGADRAPVRERAENALTELRAGIPLTAVGNKYTTPGRDLVTDASEASWIAPEDLQPEILAAVNNLTPLDYSELIEGRFGYHIIQLMDHKEGRAQPLEEVAASIDNFLRNEKMGVELDSYTAGLMKKASIEIYAEEFTDLEKVWDEGNEGAPTGTPGRGR